MKVTVRQTFSLLLAAVILCACSRSSLEHNNGVVISAEFSADSGSESYLIQYAREKLGYVRPDEIKFDIDGNK